MPANTSPIFTVTPKVSWPTTNPLGTLAVTATTSAAYDGTTNATLVYTAGSNGSYIQKLIFEAGGTNAVSVARVFVNNGSTNATASNNVLVMQYSLPSSISSSTQSTTHLEVPLMIQLPATYRLYVSFGATSNLAAGWYVSVVGGDY